MILSGLEQWNLGQAPIDNKNELKIIMELFVIYLSQSNRPFSELLKPKFIYFEDLYRNALEGTLREKCDIDTLIQSRIDIFEAIKQNLLPEHKEFLISLMSLEPKWELLSFKNIHCLPGIQWKLKNIEMMSIY